jgi:O-antigen/teichoic acid export membrane protein
VAWAAAAAGVLGVLLSPRLMVAVYGESFAPAGGVFRLLVLVCVFSALSGHYRFGLIAVGKQKVEMWASILGAVAAAILVPTCYLWKGVEGSALALVLVEVIVWSFAWRCARRAIGLRGHAKMLARPLAVTALTSVVVFYFGKDAALLIRVLTVIILFSLMAYLSDPSLREILRERAEAILLRLRAKEGKGMPQAAP